MPCSVSQAAHKIGVSTNSLKDLLRSGEIPSFLTAGGHHRIVDEALEEYMARRASVPGRAVPHLRLIKGLLVAYDGDTAEVGDVLRMLCYPVPDLQLIRTRLLRELPVDARVRAESGGHWVRSIRKDCGWLGYLNLEFIVEAIRGRREVPKGSDVSDFNEFGYRAPWACLLFDENYPRRVLAEALSTAKGHSDEKVCRLLKQHCGFAVDEIQLGIFQGAAYHVEGLDWQSYLSSLPPMEREAKRLALEAPPEVVVALLRCNTDDFLNFSERYHSLAMLTAHKLQKAIMAGDGRAANQLSQSLVQLEQRSKATEIRSLRA